MENYLILLFRYLQNKDGLELNVSRILDLIWSDISLSHFRRQCSNKRISIWSVPFQ